MKNWLWFLGISCFLIVACQEASEHGTNEPIGPAFRTLVADTPPPIVWDVDPDYQEDQNNVSEGYKSIVLPPQAPDTSTMLPVVHMGDKDYNPNLAGKNKAMLDSLRKAQTAQNRIWDSIARAKHPLPGDTMKSRERK